MPEASSYDYAVLRVVPHVERAEFVNVGVILFCRTRRFLGIRIAVDDARLLALHPALDLDMVDSQLALIERITGGGEQSGPIGQLPQPDRFRWLTAPSSTTIQVSPTHCGLCTDPQATLDQLFDRLVRVK